MFDRLKDKNKKRKRCEQTGAANKRKYWCGLMGKKTWEKCICTNKAAFVRTTKRRRGEKQKGISLVSILKGMGKWWNGGRGKGRRGWGGESKKITKLVSRKRKIFVVDIIEC